MEISAVEKQVEIIHEKFETFLTAVKIWTVELAGEIDTLEEMIGKLPPGKTNLIRFPSNGDRKRVEQTSV